MNSAIFLLDGYANARNRTAVPAAITSPENTMALGLSFLRFARLFIFVWQILDIAGRPGQ